MDVKAGSWTKTSGVSSMASTPNAAPAYPIARRTKLLKLSKLIEKMIKVYRTHCDVRGFDYHVIRDSMECV